MEDITKYIGLLGFVPFVILMIIMGKTVGRVFFEAMGIVALLLSGFGGLIWGITTLGRLL